MLAKVDYIKSVFKITEQNPYITTDIAEELAKVEDFNEFRKWLKINLNHLDTQYMNGFTKFNFLARMYLQSHQVDKARLAESSSFAKSLAEKIRSVSSYVLDNNNLKCENFVSDKECIFTDFEQTHLAKIGTLLQCVKIQRSVSGEDPLFEKLNKNMQQIVINDSIGYKPKEKTTHRVTSLIGGMVKKVTT